MQAIWNIISSIASSDPPLPSFSGGGRTRTLTIVRRGSVRGMRLSVDPRDASVRLTLGQRAAVKPAVGWAIAKRAWVEAELARLPQASPIVPGMVFDLAGRPTVIEWQTGQPRRVDFGDEVLRVGGPREQLAARVLRFLRLFALDVLAAETRSLAAAHAISVGQINVGDPRGRWGSCTTSGDIRYSWRLILAPFEVRRATVAHEVAHRIHMNHSRAFHDQVIRLYGGDPSEARRWLKAHGTTLHWFGRDN